MISLQKLFHPFGTPCTLDLKKKYPSELNHDDSLFTISIVLTSGRIFVTLICFCLPGTKIQFLNFFFFFAKKGFTFFLKKYHLYFAPTSKTSFVYIHEISGSFPVDTTGYVNNNKKRKKAPILTRL